MPKYTRVKDKATGHEYDVLSHRVDPEKHTRVDPRRYPEVSRPRPAKPNVKAGRPAKKNTAKAPAAATKSTTDTNKE